MGFLQHHGTPCLGVQCLRRAGFRENPVQRPGEVHSRGTRLAQALRSPFQGVERLRHAIARALECRQRHTVGSCNANRWRSPYDHGTDGVSYGLCLPVIEIDNLLR